MEKIDNAMIGNAHAAVVPATQVELEDPSSFKSDFVERITHDVQGGFFGVTSLCLTLKNAIEDSNDPTSLLDPLMDACQWYRFKLKNFLEYTRFEAGLRGMMLEPIDIRILLNKVANELESMAAEHNTELQVLVPPDFPTKIMMDEYRMIEIFTNLVSNAITFAGQGKEVSIAVSVESDSEFTLICRDNGEGMTQEQLESIFSQSFRKRKILNNPAGLGLIVTRNLVEDVFGGRLLISSKPQAGTTCYVTLPLKVVLVNE